MKTQQKLQMALDLAWTYLSTTQESRKQANLFKDIETFCTFIGYSRSGHSLIAALLDAHPNVVMAHEQGVMKYIYVGYDRLRLYHLLLQNTQIKGHSQQRRGDYKYDVPNQWQGNYQNISVIGDKHGEDSVCRLAADPWLLERMRNTVQVPIRFVHVIRNPFDNITTMAIRMAEGNTNLSASDLEAAIARYFRVCEAVKDVKTRVNQTEVFDLYHEEFVQKPVEQLRYLCTWLGLEASQEYLEACSGIVFDSPRKSRHKVEWDKVLRQKVESKIKLFPFLEGYTFEET